ncbi:hypothetical protein [Polaromonas eurypsychrophila]|uniref:hypothetical protein n=1 Tax=Polaromonas eurypsychrophila TaxID=1614635 RepID=UPI00166AF9B2|nr:hypothetical protein [Polaromonas eurypsychrophila]
MAKLFGVFGHEGFHFFCVGVISLFAVAQFFCPVLGQYAEQGVGKVERVHARGHALLVAQLTTTRAKSKSAGCGGFEFCKSLKEINVIRFCHARAQAQPSHPMQEGRNGGLLARMQSCLQA